MDKGKYASEFRRVDESSDPDNVKLSIHTASGDVLERVTTTDAWNTIKKDGPTMYACGDHDKIADETGKLYPAYSLRCPICDAMMERISIMTR